MKKILWLYLAVLVVPLSRASEPLIVHEWGTFTVLQDERGDPVPGVNINEESLPPFVYKLAAELAPDSHELGPLIGVGHFAALRSKGIRRYYHAALMRMETPIIYLYPPAGDADRAIDLQVQFRGGWITEWFPQAEAVAPGYAEKNKQLMMDLKPETVGRIAWNGVQFRAQAELPETDFPVWLAPRKTAAVPVVLPGGDAEKYLFYRGVANLESPLRVAREGEEFVISLNSAAQHKISDFSTFVMWLVEIAADGALHFRTVATNRSGEILARTPADFTTGGTDGDRLALRVEMKQVLVEEGLFADEAEAMLNTWEVSYFRTPGVRLFFNLPQSWTDSILPLSISGYAETEVQRAMIGRVELVSSRQHELLAQIAAGPVSTSEWFFAKWYKDMDPATFNDRQMKLFSGAARLEDFGLEVPADYQAYMELGRFRDALILHYFAKNQQENLKQFALNYRLPLE